MNTNPNHKPAGTPAGGQFAPSTHPRPGIELDAPESVVATEEELESLARAKTDRRTHVQVAAHNTLEVSRGIEPDCARCGEPIRLGNCGPVSWIEDGVERGGHNFQHGCGGWNQPMCIEVDIEGMTRDEVVAAISSAKSELDAAETPHVKRRYQQQLELAKQAEAERARQSERELQSFGVERSQEWVAQGFDAREALAWVAVGCENPSAARAWVNAGHTPRSALAEAERRSR